jgi:hypothetical protein
MVKKNVDVLKLWVWDKSTSASFKDGLPDIEQHFDSL